MSEKVIVALDAMGGDNAPVEIVKGAVEAVKEEAGLLVKLVGREEQVCAELAKYTYPQGQIEVVDAPDVIETGCSPVSITSGASPTSIRRDRLKWLMHRTLLKPVSSRLWQSAGKKILPWYVR